MRGFTTNSCAAKMRRTLCAGMCQRDTFRYLERGAYVRAWVGGSDRFGWLARISNLLVRKLWVSISVFESDSTPSALTNIPISFNQVSSLKRFLGTIAVHSS